MTIAQSASTSTKVLNQIFRIVTFRSSLRANAESMLRMDLHIVKSLCVKRLLKISKKVLIIVELIKSPNDSSVL